MTRKDFLQKKSKHSPPAGVHMHNFLCERTAGGSPSTDLLMVAYNDNDQARTVVEVFNDVMR